MQPWLRNTAIKHIRPKGAPSYWRELAESEQESRAKEEEKGRIPEGMANQHSASVSWDKPAEMWLLFSTRPSRDFINVIVSDIHHRSSINQNPEVAGKKGTDPEM